MSVSVNTTHSQLQVATMQIIPKTTVLSSKRLCVRFSEHISLAVASGTMQTIPKTTPKSSSEHNSLAVASGIMQIIPKTTPN